MPIQIIPAPNVPDPMQQMGQMYEMMTMMQMAPLKRQALEGQIAAQQTAQEQAQVGMQSTRQEMSLRTNAEQRLIDDLAKKKAKEDAEAQSTIAAIQRAGVELSPGDLAMIQSGGDPNKLLGPAGLALQQERIKADPLLGLDVEAKRANIAQSRAAAGASAESRVTQQRLRQIAEEDRSRKLAGEGALAEGVGAAAPADSNPTVTLAVQNALKNGTPWSAIPISMQEQVAPSLRDSQDAKELQRKVVEQQLERAKLETSMAQDTFARFQRGEATPEEARASLEKLKSNQAALIAEQAKERADRLEKIQQGKIKLAESGNGPKEIAAYEVGALRASAQADKAYEDAMKGIAAIYDPALKTAADINQKLFSPTTPAPNPTSGVPSLPQADANLSDAATLEIKSMSPDRFVATLKDLLASGTDDAKRKATIMLKARDVPADPSGVANWVTSNRAAKPVPLLGLPSIADVESDVIGGMRRNEKPDGPSIFDMMRYGQGDADVVNELLKIQQQIQVPAGSGAAGVRGP